MELFKVIDDQQFSNYEFIYQNFSISGNKILFLMKSQQYRLLKGEAESNKQKECNAHSS